LGRHRRASQAEHDQNESDGSRRGVHRVLHGQQEVNSAYTRHDTHTSTLRPNRNRIAP
jgi:hypothetical protein